jgi:hypothetical protein
LSVAFGLIIDDLRLMIAVVAWGKLLSIGVHRLPLFRRLIGLTWRRRGR